MTATSKQFGEAQYFATHRVSSYTAWALYRDGQERRLFAHADEQIHNTGTPLPEEADILAHLPDPAAAENDPDYWQRHDIRSPEEEDVLGLAGTWSFDPSTLDSDQHALSVGAVGRMLRTNWQPVA
jgi:hypothetical protein